MRDQLNLYGIRIDLRGFQSQQAIEALEGGVTQLQAKRAAARAKVSDDDIFL